MYRIQLIEKEEIYVIIPFLEKLNAKISKDTLQERLKEMISRGYQCVGVYNVDQLIGISGIWILTKYYVGKHIEPDNVYIHSDYQGKGIGKLLMQWIYDYGKAIGCEASELNCYTENKAGFKFWKDQGYEVVGYHFQKQFKV